MAELKTKIKNKTNRKKSRKNDENASMYLKTSQIVSGTISMQASRKFSVATRNES